MLAKVKRNGHSGGVARGYGQFCGLARALDLVGGRWALLVVRDLLTGPKRFSELQEGLHGVPTNVLTSRLRELEEAGIVERRVQAHPGRGVAYALTEYGLELEEPVLRLGFWGAKTMGPPCEGDFISVDSLALALRGAFRPEKARGPKRLYEVRIDGRTVRLTPSEFRLLAFLAQEPEHVYTRREIMQHLWDSTYVGDQRACDIHVSNLRRKIEETPGRPKRLVTVRGVGYKLLAV